MGCTGSTRGKNGGALFERTSQLEGKEDLQTLVPEGARDAVLGHDYLLVRRGAERVFLAMAELWPSAPVATLLYDGSVFDDRLGDREVRTSSLQRLGADQGSFKRLMPLLPSAAERLDVSGSPLLVTSSSAYAHGFVPDAGATHVCVCHTPFRYAWYEHDNGIRQAPKPLRPLVRRALDKARRWDYQAAQRDTHYVAVSRLSQERIRRYWGRDAEIVHPPVELDRFTPGERSDYVLVVAELVRHKRVDFALEAARRAGVKIKVVGGGADAPRLHKLYGGSAEFLGRVSDDELAVLYRHARALVMPNVEEFGITAVEAQASGCPVIAVDAGGAQETVIDGETGVLVPVDDVHAMTAVLADHAGLDALKASDCVRNATRFSPRAFQIGLLRQVHQALGRPVPAALREPAPSPAAPSAAPSVSGLHGIVAAQPASI